ncbi:hypothetical protein PF004_g1080 [Phytophthora fragariae]|uniref:ERCC4 domain-containing protein n=1 Tax=Phytophthora fragariae TaxID=53985 RepID=A0A6G0PTU0_9STRA|nr:hypothetical protein PF004_g1080 [Phytophthora fragariae]
MSTTPSPRPARARKRPRDSLETDEDDHALDAMLVELGIPDSGSKKKKKKNENNSSPSVEVIELLTPPRSLPKEKTKPSDGPSFVDLTTSPSSPHPSPLPAKNGYISTSAIVSQDETFGRIAVEIQEQKQEEEQEQEEISFSYSPSGSPPPFIFSLPPEPSPSSFPPAAAVALDSNSDSDSPEVLSPELMTSTRRRVFPDEKKRVAAKQARRLSGRLRDLHSETIRSSGGGGKKRKESVVTTVSETEVAAVKTTTSPVRSRTGASPSKPRNATGGRGGGSSSGAGGVVAVVQMEKSLDTSAAGDSIRTALKSHVYNGKHVPFTVATALNCIIPGVIRWERRENGSSHYSCAIYYEADTFLEMIRLKSYKELVAAVRYLQSLVPTSQQQTRKSCQPGEDEEEASKFFVIVEGMDRALIELKKQHKQKSKKNGSTPSTSSTSSASSTSASTPMISFADLHEVAFQLFMDMGAHTKFTCDLDATVNYVALLTREFVVASSRASALEEFLESVPRNNSFRVTRTGATASVCANAWLRMLQVIPGVSEDKAQCLLDHFPTYGSLMRAYRDPSLSQAQKEDLVADKLHDARIQRALSKRIYTVFCEQNPDALV